MGTRSELKDKKYLTLAMENHEWYFPDFASKTCLNPFLGIMNDETVPQHPVPDYPQAHTLLPFGF